AMRSQPNDLCALPQTSCNGAHEKPRSPGVRSTHDEWPDIEGIVCSHIADRPVPSRTSPFHGSRRQSSLVRGVFDVLAKPDLRWATHPCLRHSRLQILRVRKPHGCVHVPKLVHNNDDIGVMSVAMDTRGCDAFFLTQRRKSIIDALPVAIVTHLVSNKHSSHGQLTSTILVLVNPLTAKQLSRPEQNSGPTEQRKGE